MKHHKALSDLRHTRPLEKCVDITNIRAWIPEQARRRIDTKRAWTIIKTHYCAALVGRGVCPIQCEDCREALESMFGLDDAKKPEALLTWRAKDRSAVMIEKLIAAQKCERDEGLLSQGSEFPVLESAADGNGREDPLAALFPRKPVENLFLEMDKDYA